MKKDKLEWKKQEENYKISSNFITPLMNLEEDEDNYIFFLKNY